MVIMQTVACYGLLVAMLHPSCTSNAQCSDRTGFYCMEPGDPSFSWSSGVCQMCGEAAPLPPYDSFERVPGCEPDSTTRPITCNEGVYKQYNLIWDRHYSPGFLGKRSATPDAFAGFNFTMIKERCTHPIQGFHWEYTGKGESTVVTDRGDIPDWISTDRLKPREGFSKFSQASAVRWCNACVQAADAVDERDGLMVSDTSGDTGLSVSIMNKRLLAMSNLNTMNPADWVALFLCSYLVGLTVVSEIKDIALCEAASFLQGCCCTQI